MRQSLIELDFRIWNNRVEYVLIRVFFFKLLTRFNTHFPVADVTSTGPKQEFRQISVHWNLRITRMDGGKKQNQETCLVAVIFSWIWERLGLHNLGNTAHGRLTQSTAASYTNISTPLAVVIFSSSRRDCFEIIVYNLCTNIYLKNIKKKKKNTVIIIILISGRSRVILNCTNESIQ